MMAALILMLITWLGSLNVYLPSPQDLRGWGLRVHNFSVRGPFLWGEVITRDRFHITLINFSKDTQSHDYLPVARNLGDLDVHVCRLATGEEVGVITRWTWPRDPLTEQNKLRPGEIYTHEFRFKEFGYLLFGPPGRYRLVAMLKIGGKTIKSPPIELEVIEVPESDVLTNYRIPLEGIVVRQSSDNLERVAIQQVKVENRTLLILRRYNAPKYGGKASFTTRLAELPGKVEMKVEGAYGAGKPLTITYKTSPTAEPTKLVINSISGSPWTEEEEHLLREREEARTAPMPRPVKP